MKMFELLIGRKMKVMTEVGVEVELTIKSIKENSHSQDLEPATAANDWWPPSRDWSTFTVTFTTGKSKTFDNLNEIEVI